MARDRRPTGLGHDHGASWQPARTNHHGGGPNGSGRANDALQAPCRRPQAMRVCAAHAARPHGVRDRAANRRAQRRRRRKSRSDATVQHYAHRASQVGRGNPALNPCNRLPHTDDGVAECSLRNSGPGLRPPAPLERKREPWALKAWLRSRFLRCIRGAARPDRREW